jgi:hypothetical protein
MTSPPGRFACGPLDIEVEASEPVVHARLGEPLGIYDQRWPDPRRSVKVVATATDGPAPSVSGTFLLCSRMAVDRIGSALVGVTRSGVHGTGHLGPAGECWNIAVPLQLLESEALDELEDLVGLALTTGWRRAGWVPVHAAAVANGPRVALLCSESGGGKSTLTASMLRRGWCTLGDDKLLLRLDAGRTPEIGSLLSTFNLDPRTNEWMPEIGPLDHLPRYSAWTEKRRVQARAIWSGGVISRGQPTHLVELRRVDRRGVRTTPLPPAEVLSALLRQVVLPSDAATTKPMLACLGTTAGRLAGVRMEVGPDAYSNTDVAAILDQALP